MKNKTCRECGQDFEPTTGSQTLCPTCRSATGYKLRTCPVCGEAFLPTRSRQPTCQECAPAWNRARQFLSSTSDCTTSLVDIAKLWAAGVDWQGRPLDPGVKYVTEHVHGGPVTGIVRQELNMIMTEYARNNWDEVLAFHAFSELALDRDDAHRMLRYQARAIQASTEGERWSILAAKLNRVAGRRWSPTYVQSAANGSVEITKTMADAARTLAQGGATN